MGTWRERKIENCVKRADQRRQAKCFYKEKFTPAAITFHGVRASMLCNYHVSMHEYAPNTSTHFLLFYKVIESMEEVYFLCEISSKEISPFFSRRGVSDFPEDFPFNLNWLKYVILGKNLLKGLAWNVQRDRMNHRGIDAIENCENSQNSI